MTSEAQSSAASSHLDAAAKNVSRSRRQCFLPRCAFSRKNFVINFSFGENPSETRASAPRSLTSHGHAWWGVAGRTRSRSREGEAKFFVRTTLKLQSDTHENSVL